MKHNKWLIESIKKDRESRKDNICEFIKLTKDGDVFVLRKYTKCDNVITFYLYSITGDLSLPIEHVIGNGDIVYMPSTFEDKLLIQGYLQLQQQLAIKKLLEGIWRKT